MKKPLLSLLASLLLTATALHAQLTDETYLYDGLNRTYKLYRPSGLAPSAPLVFVLHGYTSSSSTIMNTSHMNDVADANGFAVCYPQGTHDNAGITHWNINFPGDPVNDIGFLTSLASDLQTIYDLDPGCTYVCGMSNGGMMSYYLACSSTDTFHAFASVTGTITETFKSSCSGNINVPFMEFHGTSDIIVPYNGSSGIPLWGEFFGIQPILQKWYNSNNCQSLTSQAVPQAPVVDYSSATRYDLTGCDGGLKAVHYKIQGGGHTWPGGPSQGFFDIIQPTNQDVDASAEIWSFFQSICSPSSGLAGGALTESPDILLYPNPANESAIARLTGAEHGMLRLYSITGTLLLEQALQQGDNSVDISQLAAGIYVVRKEVNGEISPFKWVIE